MNNDQNTGKYNTGTFKERPDTVIFHVCFVLPSCGDCPFGI